MIRDSDHPAKLYVHLDRCGSGIFLAIPKMLQTKYFGKVYGLYPFVVLFLVLRWLIYSRTGSLCGESIISGEVSRALILLCFSFSFFLSQLRFLPTNTSVSIMNSLWPYLRGVVMANFYERSTLVKIHDLRRTQFIKLC